MKLATISDLRSLIDHRDEHSVSILMPTTPLGAQHDKNRIRFKTLLARAEKEMHGKAVSDKLAGKILKPVRELETERPFWKACSQGLAVYAATGVCHTFRLPFEVEERVEVGARFLTRPLTRLIARERRFLLLALGLGDNRLFEATPHMIREIPAENLPDNISDTLRYDVFEKHLQGHPTSRAMGSGARMTFHGHASSKEDRDSQIRRYIGAVAEEITKLLAGESAPLVVATLPYLLPVFRQACGYPHLAEESVEVDPGHMDVAELHRRSLKAAEEVFGRDVRNALDRYGDSVGAGLATCSAEEVVLASCEGRVDTLFLGETGGLFGECDLQSRRVDVHSRPQPGDTDLLDLAAEQTLLKGGRVISPGPRRMPEGSAMAAILRY